jgi:hypothetical protein
MCIITEILHKMLRAFLNLIISEIGVPNLTKNITSCAEVEIADVPVNSKNYNDAL